MRTSIKMWATTKIAWAFINVPMAIASAFAVSSGELWALLPLAALIAFDIRCCRRSGGDWKSAMSTALWDLYYSVGIMLAAMLPLDPHVNWWILAPAVMSVHALCMNFRAMYDLFKGRQMAGKYRN